MVLTGRYEAWHQDLVADKAQLATVQREMHREGISPYYWATFGVYGLP